MTTTHKHYIISIQYPSHKWLPEKSCVHCLRILIMSWLFKDLVITMKEIMSGLFKVQFTVAWLNVAMPNQTVKNGLMVKKINLPQINSFLEKQLMKCSCTYQPFHSAKFYKNSSSQSRVMRMCHFQAQNVSFALNNFFWYKPLLLLSSTYWPFSLCKI